MSCLETQGFLVKTYTNDLPVSLAGASCESTQVICRNIWLYAEEWGLDVISVSMLLRQRSKRHRMCRPSHVARIINHDALI